ncbi:MAG: hypothetical protein H7Z14_07745 [Anaerolineae bacterium]|nr:hypothetical protein [Phycisphaerae bacterium]
MPTPADKIPATKFVPPQDEHALLPIDSAEPVVSDDSPFKFPQHAAAIEDRMLDADWREFFNARHAKRSK